MFDPRLGGILGAAATLPAWDGHTQGRSQGFADADWPGAAAANSVGQGAVEDMHHVTITHPGIWVTSEGGG